METKNNLPMPEWAKIVIKTLIYALGLLLAGVGTASAAEMIGIL